jgi:hypothetical protein
MLVAAAPTTRTQVSATIVMARVKKVSMSANLPDVNVRKSEGELRLNRAVPSFGKRQDRQKRVESARNQAIAAKS